MTEQQAVLNRLSHPDATRKQKESEHPPKDVYELLHQAIDKAQGHTFLQRFNSTRSLKERYDASRLVATLANGQSVYLGTRKDSRGKKVYGFITGLQTDENGNLQDDISGKERVYRTDEDIRELFGDEAKRHAALILSRIAMDKIKLPKDIIEHAADMGLASIAPAKKDGSAVVYVPDKTGKIVRFFTEKPLPKNDDDREALISEVNSLLQHQSVQEGLERTFFRAVDIEKDKGKLWIHSSGEVRDPANAVPIVNLVRKEDIDTDVDVEINDHYVFPSKMKREQKEADIQRFREEYNVEPKQKKIDTGEGNPTTVFGPGWSMGGVTDSAERVGASFANEYNTPTLILDSRPEQLVEDSYWKEAQAMVELIKRERRKKITLVGHSQGGIKMAYVALLLQRERKEGKPNIPEVEGLILIDSVGLYDQQGELAKGFIKDSVLTGGTSITEKVKYWGKRLMGQPRKGSSIAHDAGRLMQKRGIQAVIDIVGKGAGKELVRSTLSGDSYKARLESEIESMSAFSEEHQARLAELECSIVMMHGQQDPISDPERVVPGYTTMNLSQREEALKRTIFRNARSIQMITAQDKGRHGLPLFRPETVATVAHRLMQIATNPELYPVRTIADIEVE